MLYQSPILSFSTADSFTQLLGYHLLFFHYSFKNSSTMPKMGAKEPWGVVVMLSHVR